MRPKCSSRHAKLWWLCTSCVDAGAEDLEHLVDNGVATGVRVLAGELHRRDVRLAELGVDLEEHRRRVHLTLVGAIAEAQPLREREEPRRRSVAEATRPEMDADPDPALLVLHEVDVVVARPDRAELRLGELRQLALRREFGGTDLLEDGVVDALLRRNTHAERDPARDLAHDRVDAADGVEIDPRQLGTSGLVAAPDVVAHA